MTPKDLILSQLGASQFLFESFTKDFSEQDAKFQPLPGGNHLNWILVHLAGTEDWVISTLTGQPKQLSEHLHKTYGGSSTCDANDGMTKAEAWKIFTQQRARTVDFIKTFPESRYNDPNPTSIQMFKKVGDMIGLLGTHPFWHFGQLSVNRRMLKKPPIFGAPS